MSRVRAGLLAFTALAAVPGCAASSAPAPAGPASPPPPSRANVSQDAEPTPPPPLGPAERVAREFMTERGLRVVVEPHPEQGQGELSLEFEPSARLEHQLLVTHHLRALEPELAGRIGPCGPLRICVRLARGELERSLARWLSSGEPSREQLESARQSSSRELAQLESEPAARLDDFARLLAGSVDDGPWGTQLLASWTDKQLRAAWTATWTSARLRLVGPFSVDGVERRWGSTSLPRASTASTTTGAATGSAAAGSGTTTSGSRWRTAEWLWLDVDRGGRLVAYVEAALGGPELPALAEAAGVQATPIGPRLLRLIGPATELVALLESPALASRPRLLAGAQAVLEAALPRGAAPMRLDPLTHRARPASPLPPSRPEPSPEY